MRETSNNHLTTGNLTHGLLRLAGPMFASAMLQNAQSLIDLFWVGKLGSAAVAALAMSGTVLMLLFPVIMGTATGTVALVSRHVGAGDHKHASELAIQSVLIAMLQGLVVGIIACFFTEQIFTLLGAGDLVRDLGSDYLRISFLGSFAVFALFIGNSALQGAGNSVIPMCVMMLANVINIVLDPVLIFGMLGAPRMGVSGAALATVISHVVAAVFVLFFLFRGVGVLKVHGRDCRLRPALAWQIMRIGIPSGGQMLSRSLMALVLMRIVAICGTAAVAAYGIGIRFLMITLMPTFSLGNAAATMVGQNLGADNPDRAQASAWLAVKMELINRTFSSLVLCVFAPGLIRFFESSQDVVAIGTAMLRTISPFYLFAGIAIILGRALHGAGKTIATMVFTVISLWGLQVPLAIILSRMVQPATLGIWWANSIAVTFHGILLLFWFQTGRWKK